jgi:hypothetical protein
VVVVGVAVGGELVVVAGIAVVVVGVGGAVVGVVVVAGAVVVVVGDVPRRRNAVPSAPSTRTPEGSTWSCHRSTPPSGMGTVAVAVGELLVATTTRRFPGEAKPVVTAAPSM